MRNVATLSHKWLVVAVFGRKNTRDSVGNYMPAKDIQQTCDKPKETPRNNHFCNLPPTREHSPIPMPLFPPRFLMKSQFLIAIQGLKLGI